MRLYDQRALIFSFVLHALVFAVLATQHQWDWGQSKIWDPSGNSLQTRTLSENDFQKLSQLRKKQQSEQIVQSENLKSAPTLAAPITEKIYKSAATNVVDKNTRAGRVGEFKNVPIEGLQETRPRNDRKPASVGEGKPTLVENLFKVPVNDLNVPKGQANRGPASVPSPEKTGQGFSASNDYLPDVSIGANTLLNTQEFKYYGFYERIRQKLSLQWETRLRNSFESLVRQGVKQITGDRITRLRVHLSSDGQLVRSDVLGTSGYHELDRAALEAFKAAAPFPNPPKALMATGDSLTIDWSFVVVTAEDSGVRFSVRRAPGTEQ